MAAILSRRASAAFVLVLAMSLLNGPGASATEGNPSAKDTAARTTHKSTSMVDVSTPYFEGYNRKLRAYKFVVYGRWSPACDGDFCWPAPCLSCDGLDIGSNDAVRIRFSDAVSFKKMAITNQGACGDTYYSETKRFSSGSFEDAFAGVNDEVVTSWVHTWFNGETVINDGYCKRNTLPIRSGIGGGTGGGGGFRHYGDLKGRAFTFTVWVNPLPSQGRCYDRLYVKAGYTHTWTDQGLSWSLGYPWSVGVGVTNTDDSFTVWQDTDGFKDAQLTTPRMCKH